MKTFVTNLVLIVTSIFAPLKTALIAAFILCTVDMIVGMIAASKRGESITSAKLRRTISKLFVWELVLALTFVAEAYLSLDTIFPAVKTVSALIASVELLSIFENLNEISGQNLLASVIQKLGSKNDEKSHSAKK